MLKDFTRTVFFDLCDSKEMITNGNSKYNKDEIDFTFKLIELFSQMVGAKGSMHLNKQEKHPLAGRIGVISPYKSQVVQLRE